MLSFFSIFAQICSDFAQLLLSFCTVFAQFLLSFCSVSPMSKLYQDITDDSKNCVKLKQFSVNVQVRLFIAFKWANSNANLCNWPLSHKNIPREKSHGTQNAIFSTNWDFLPFDIFHFISIVYFPDVLFTIGNVFLIFFFEWNKSRIFD